MARRASICPRRDAAADVLMDIKRVTSYDWRTGWGPSLGRLAAKVKWPGPYRADFSALFHFPVDLAPNFGRQRAEGVVHAVAGACAGQAEDVLQLLLGDGPLFAEDLAAMRHEHAAIGVGGGWQAA